MGSDLRWIVEEDGTKRLQYREPYLGGLVWTNVPEIPASDEYDYHADRPDAR